MLVELTVLIATIAGLLLGSCCIYWVKANPSVRQARWGRRLFVATLMSLGAIAFVAAFMRADGLAPIGLLAGLLTVGMLWETPTPTPTPSEPEA